MSDEELLETHKSAKSYYSLEQTRKSLLEEARLVWERSKEPTKEQRISRIDSKLALCKSHIECLKTQILEYEKELRRRNVDFISFEAF